MKNMKITDTTLMIGIYSINFPNGKRYIGQSQNIHLRMLEHNSRAKNGKRGDGKSLSLCDKKIKQYFPKGVQEYEVLEECSVNELDEKEKYWIKYFDSTNKDKGYNFLDRGDVSGRRGVDSVNASLNQSQLDEIIDLLTNHYELSYKDIAEKMNVSLSVVQRISWGQNYVQSNLKYPLRKDVHSFQKKTLLDYFSSEEQLLELKNDLKYSWWLSIEKDLVNKYNIPLNIMHDINTGKRFSEIGDFTYPIRNKNIRNKNNLSKEDILELLNLLRTTSSSMTELGEKYNFDRSVISKINKGVSYFIVGYDYPARKTK